MPRLLENFAEHADDEIEIRILHEGKLNRIVGLNLTGARGQCTDPSLTAFAERSS